MAGTLGVTGNTTVGGTLGVTGNTTVGGTFGVTGVSTLSDNIVFGAASKGVYLGVTSATASNLLDDYEEGTWTPTASCTDGNGSLAYNYQVGHYTKVGNMVNITCYMALSSISGASGDFRIAGVPFTSQNVANAYIVGSMWMNTTVSGQIFDGDYHLQTYLAANDTTVRFFSMNGGGAATQLTTAMLNNTTDFMLNITYRV
jgi:hypothetical protein